MIYLGRLTKSNVLKWIFTRQITKVLSRIDNALFSTHLMSKMHLKYYEVGNFQIKTLVVSSFCIPSSCLCQSCSSVFVSGLTHFHNCVRHCHFSTLSDLHVFLIVARKVVSKYLGKQWGPDAHGTCPVQPGQGQKMLGRYCWWYCMHHS